MNNPVYLIFLLVLLGAGIWNFVLSALAPQLTPRTLRGCALWAGVEGLLIGAAALVVQSAPEGLSGGEAILGVLRYPFGWFIVSFFSKNQYRLQRTSLFRDTTIPPSGKPRTTENADEAAVD